MSSVKLMMEDIYSGIQQVRHGISTKILIGKLVLVH